MQNRYTGDIGDFGKLGLLRTLQDAGLSLGVNWYLVLGEGERNNDGKFTQYLDDPFFQSCDSQLCSELKRIVGLGQRNVCSIQDSGLLDAVYYSEELSFSDKTKQERIAFRQSWHREALKALTGVDIVFVDPDNGLLVPSAMGTRRENKYVTPCELADYYANGSSIVYYQHQARKPDPFYTKMHGKLLASPGFEGASGLGVKFTKTSLRYYFFIMQPKHKEVITNAVNQMLASEWIKLFTELDMSIGGGEKP